MSKLEVNEISKTATGDNITISSEMVLQDTVQIFSQTGQQVNARLNPIGGQLVYRSDDSVLLMYSDATSTWVPVGGTEHTQAFNTILVAGQSNVATTVQNDSITFVGGDEISIVTDAGNKFVTFNFDGIDTSALAQGVIPSVNNTYDIGATGFRWKDIHLQGDIEHGTNTIGSNATGITMEGSLQIDSLEELTLDEGVTIESVKMEDGDVALDSLTEATASSNIALNNNLVLAAGTTIDFSAGSATGLSGGGGGTNANLLINGGFDIWQWQDTGSYTNNGAIQSVDRWVTTGTGASRIDKGSFTLGQTDVPQNPKHYARWYNNNTSSCVMEQRIEDVETGANGDVTYSFYARTASGAETLNIQATQVFGVSSASSPVTTAGDSHTLDATWTQYSGTINLPSVSGKTKGNLDSKKSYRDRLAFQFEITGSFDVYIANVKLELGGSVTAYEPPKYQDELNNCMRYFQKSGRGSSTYGQDQIVGYGFFSRSGVLDGTLPYWLPMYRVPDVTRGGRFRFRRGIYSATGNYLNYNLNNDKDDKGWGCWNVDLSNNNNTGYSAQITCDSTSTYLYFNAEI